MRTGTVYFLVTLSALFWGSNFTLAGPVMADLPPLWAAALRFALGSAIMLTVARWRGEALAAPARRHAGVYALLGAVGIGTFNLMFFFALQRTSPANAALIMATNPLLTTVLAALLLGDRASPRQLAALPVALAGVAVVVSDGQLHRLAGLHLAGGDWLMVVADVAFALYNVLVRRYMPAGSPLVNTALVMVSGTLLLVLVAAGSAEAPVMPGPAAGAALLGMAVGGTVLAYLFWNTGIARLGAGRTALFANLVPVFAMLVQAAVGTVPTGPQLLGGLLVIGAVSVATLPRRRRTGRAQGPALADGVNPPAETSSSGAGSRAADRAPAACENPG